MNQDGQREETPEPLAYVHISQISDPLTAEATLLRQATQPEEPTPLNIEQVTDWARRLPWPLWPAVMIVVLASAAAIYSWLQARGGDYFEYPELTQLTTTGAVTSDAISPDGKYIAYSKGWDMQSLHVRQLATGSEIEMIPLAPVRYLGLTFSPDASYIYYVTGPVGVLAKDLFRVPVFGGLPRSVLRDVGSRVSFSPNGKRFVFIRLRVRKDEDALISANADGSDERTIITLKFPEQLKDAAPAWSPDGKLIAVPVSEANYHHLSIVPAEGGPERIVGPADWQEMHTPNWVENGRKIIVDAGSRSQIMPQIWEISYPRGRTRQITNEMSIYRDVGITANSNLLSAIRLYGVSNLSIADAIQSGSGKTGMLMHQLTTGTARFGFAGLTWISERHLAYSTENNKDSDIGTIDQNGSNEMQITRGENVLGVSACSDRYLVFTSLRFDPPSIWRVDVDGRNRKLLARRANSPSCSPDGKWVVFTSVSDGKKVLKMSIEGGQEATLADGPAEDPQFSPDGQKLAYSQRAASGFSAIAIAAASGGTPNRILGAGEVNRMWHWEPNSQAIDYLKVPNGVYNIWRLPLDGRLPQPLTHFDSGVVTNFAWSPTGKRLAISKGSGVRDVVLIENTPPAH
jgi:Tol biopolymer transport system component